MHERAIALAVVMAVFVFNSGCGEGKLQTEEPATVEAKPFLFLLDQYNSDGIATSDDRLDTWDAGQGYYERISRDLPGGVPVTLESFKAVFGIGQRGVAPADAAESLDDYRSRIRAAVYYNANELGLGREMACTPEPGFVDTNGEVGQACFVTNYGGAGDAFYDPETAMAHAIAGVPAKNTVAISYRPSQRAAFRDQGVDDASIQFWVYDAAGNLQNYAQLDQIPGAESSSRPVPSVCTECHGASAPYTRGLVADGGHFLPANPFTVTHLQGDDIEERLRMANCAAVSTGRLTASQQSFVNALYSDVCTAGNEPENAAPAEWNDSPGQAELWQQAAAGACGTCHLALDTPILGSRTRTLLCAGAMPHAYPTWLRARGEMGGNTEIQGSDPDGNERVFPDALSYLKAWAGAEDCH
jgi:hypothetical protein